MSSSLAPKRRRTGYKQQPTAKTSKIRSCEACRKLKTRCEATADRNRCHRCKVLNIECSLNKVTRNSTHVSEVAESRREFPPCQERNCHERLHAVEISLFQLQALLSTHTTNPTADEKEKTRWPSGPAKSSPTTLQGAPMTVERATRNAPMNLIRKINDNITINERHSERQDTSEDVILNGIITEDLAKMLLKGFSKLSSRWLFMTADPMTLRWKSSLLFGTCILAGLHINPALHGSNVHQALYQYVSGLLGRVSLVCPTSLETIQSMLVFSMWNLMPNKDLDYRSNWLLSGTAAMHVIMTTNFEQLCRVKDGQVDVRAREVLRSWNLICLCHLQFSVGSGRPPVISAQYLDQCANILKFPSHNSRDELVLSGVELYKVLWELISSDTVQKDSTTWVEIENLRKSQERVYNLDSSEPLRFAYSCTYLILSRRTLQHLYEVQPRIDDTSPDSQTVAPGDSSSSNNRIDPTPFIHLAIFHSHRLLNLFLSMSDLTAFVRPAYENLLCSFAMVTLTEFAAYLTNSCETLDLMEQTIFHIQLGGKAEPVSRWALDVMRRHVLDTSAAGLQDDTQTGNHRESYNSPCRNGTPLMQQPHETPILAGTVSAQASLEDDLWNIEQEFPSLEEMFLGSSRQ